MLYEYEFDVIHRSGNKNKNADALSRLVFTYSKGNNPPIRIVASDLDKHMNYIVLSPFQQRSNVTIATIPSTSYIQYLYNYDVHIEGVNDSPVFSITLPVQWDKVYIKAQQPSPITTYDWKHHRYVKEIPAPRLTITSPHTSILPVVTRSQSDPTRPRPDYTEPSEGPTYEEALLDVLTSGEDAAVPIEPGDFEVLIPDKSIDLLPVDEKGQYINIDDEFIKLIPFDAISPPTSLETPISLENYATDMQRQRLIKAQNNDPECQEIMKQSCDESKEAMFVVIDNILYRWSLITPYSTTTSSLHAKGQPIDIQVKDEQTDETKYAIVVPVSLKPEVLYTCHDDAAAGHLGIHRTFNRIFSRFWWRGMASDIHNYVRGCAICASYKPYPLPTHGPVQTLPVPFRPFQYVSFDVVGPLPETKQKNLYILSIIDYLPDLLYWYVSRILEV